MARRPQPDRRTIQRLSDVAGAGPWRVYRAVPDTIEVRADGQEGGKPVVALEPADFRDRNG